MAKAVMAQLEKHGEVRRGMLGVIIQDLTPEIADAMNLKGHSGAIITRVQEDSPADKAGIKAGDVLVGLNDKPLKSSTDLRNRIGLTPVGEKVSIRLMRDGKEKTVTAKIENAKNEKLDGAKALSELSGAAFENSSSSVVVKQVEASSPAWNAGLREDDEILSVNRKRVTDLDEFKQEVSNASNIIILNLIRQGQELVLVIQR
jgi:S1-C subfamily serine protease